MFVEMNMVYTKEYNKGGKDSPCIRPIVLVKKLEKCPSNFTQHFSCEYIDLITLSSYVL
jgi:hypothetical protein